MTKKIKDLIILIPAFNEQKNLKKTILTAKKIANVLVVDDCSTDKTYMISKKYSDYIISNRNRKGYDYCLKRGMIEVLKNHDKNFMITIDGDGQHPINEIISLYNLLKEKKIDIIIGSRNKFNRISENIVSFFSRLFLNIVDPYSGMKGYRIKSLKRNINFLDLNKNQIGIFFILMFQKNQITEKSIKVKNKNKSSSFGDGFKINLFLLTNFFNIILKKVIKVIFKMN